MGEASFFMELKLNKKRKKSDERYRPDEEFEYAERIILKYDASVEQFKVMHCPDKCDWPRGFLPQEAVDVIRYNYSWKNMTKADVFCEIL